MYTGIYICIPVYILILYTLYIITSAQTIQYTSCTLTALTQIIAKCVSLKRSYNIHLPLHCSLGMETVGLFRRTAAKARVEALRDLIETAPGLSISSAIFPSFDTFPKSLQ